MNHASARPALALLTAVAVTVLPACYTWHATDLSPGQYVSSERPELVRLTLTDGTQTDIERPEILGGSIVGVAAPTGRGRPMTPPPVSRPLEEVVTLEVRQLDVLRTGVAATVIVGALLVVFVKRNDLVECPPPRC